MGYDLHIVGCSGPNGPCPEAFGVRADDSSPGFDDVMDWANSRGVPTRHESLGHSGWTGASIDGTDGDTCERAADGICQNLVAARGVVAEAGLTIVEIH